MRDKAIDEIARHSLPARRGGDRHRAAAGARALARRPCATSPTIRTCGSRPTSRRRWRWSAMPRPKTSIFVTGSLFLVAEARGYYRDSRHEPAPLAADLHAPDRALHHRDGHALADRFVLRWLGKLAASRWRASGRKSLLAFSFIRVRVEGLENLDPNASYVFVANHSEPHGHPRDPLGASVSVPLLRQEGPLSAFRFWART